MTLLPFDPGRAAGAEVSAGVEPAARRPDSAGAYTVSQAAELIRITLERHTPLPLRVVGQVSNLNARDHWYFSLKDSAAVLSCVAWAASARKFQFRPKDGDEIVASGQLSFYPPQGRLQLYVSAIAPVGAGALQMRFRALCDELRGLGYFDDARKRPLPLLPRRIAVITSAGGAAMHDVINTAAQRCKAVGLVIVDVRVQGDGAAQEIAHAIRWVDAQRRRLGVDAALVTRGGGSIEDLWAFNERSVADAIFKCSLPVVAAIGHESDTTIAELVADVRGSTPTQAAMRLVPSSAELCRHLDHVAHRIGAMTLRLLERRRERAQRCAENLRRIVGARLSGEHARLARLGGRLARLRPEAVLAQRSARLEALTQRLDRAIAQRLDRRASVLAAQRRLHEAARRHTHRLRERLEGMQQRLAAVDPHGVLRRGYSITAHRDGRVVKSAGEVRAGEGIVTRVADGAFESVVAGQRQRARAKPQAAGSEMDLFDGMD